MMRIVDLFCGIGGVAEAARDAGGTIVAAMDIDRDAISVYAANHGIRPQCITLESVRSIPEADLWWLSPPCQPYTRRGRRLQEADQRSQALSHLIEIVRRDRPTMVMLENVPEFDGSAHHLRLCEVLQNAGHLVRSDILCPTQWGIPMRRRRFYLWARRDGRQIPALHIEAKARSLAAYLDESSWDDPALRPSPAHIERYRQAMDVVDLDDDAATAACFTSAYGRSPVRSGSYLHCRRRGILRRFSTVEIGRLMGFGDRLAWPASLNLRTRYRLLGNSLSVTVTKTLIEAVQIDSGSELGTNR